MTVELAPYIDHTLLKPEARRSDIDRICEEALAHEFAAVCVNSSWIPQVAERLRGSAVVPCSVVGFPLGAGLSGSKASETRDVIAAGAREIDMVVALGRVLEGDWHYVREDIETVHLACNGVPLKVILETCLLTDEQIVRVCEICRELQVAFVKTSTGFSTGGATVEHVALMRKTVGPDMGVKASGGVRDRKAALAMIAAGATRLGTSSGVALVSGAEAGGDSY